MKQQREGNDGPGRLQRAVGLDRFFHGTGVLASVKHPDSFRSVTQEAK